MASKTRKTRLVILDSHAILHRAYHALPDFASKKGEPTGALYGLLTMMLKLVDELEPEYIVAARDLPGGTFRHEAFEDYKGTRTAVEDALVAQLKRAPEVFEAFGVPVYQAQGFEADDVIGTIVKQMEGNEDVEVIIATGDMDTLQLVRKGVRVFTFRKGITDTVLYDEKAVKDRYGFGPEHVVDYKALRGDPSDNIPGVKGIGEKTATDLIQKFGSVDELYKILESKPEALEKKGIKARIVELLRTSKESAMQSKMLATIHDGAPIQFKLPDHEWDISNHKETALAMCDQLEFKSLKVRIAKEVAYSEDRVEVPEREELPEVDFAQLYDTSIALWLLHSDTTNPSLEDIFNYAGTTDFNAAREHIFAELKKTGCLQEVYDQIEKPVMPIIDRMIKDGVKLDIAKLAELSAEYTKELEKIAAHIYELAGHEFNINSPKQLGVVLYDELKINPIKQKKTATGARTTREEELVKLADEHPIIGEILAHRELQKLLSTYVDKLPSMIGEDGRLHAEFLQAGTTTGRMASQNPNLQNIPIKTEYGRRIREAFVADKGNVLVALDYSQIELRIAAGMSGDENLCEVFKSGGDVHTAVASRVFQVPAENVDREMRRRAKVINFGILYGMGVNALRTNLGSEVSRAEAGEFLDNYFKTFSGLAEFLEKTKRDAEKNGYTETLFGRRRYFEGFKSNIPGMRAQTERMATNAPFQGTQSDIIKIAMVRADDLIEKHHWREKVKLALQVHDELIYEMHRDEVEKATAAIKEAMESVVAPEKLHGVPILVEAKVGHNWGEMKKM